MNWRIAALLKAFTTPMESLGNLDSEAAATLIAAASDLALVIDERGVIRDVSFHSDEFARDLDPQSSWLGRPWVDTVAQDSRSKVEAMLRETAGKAAPRWRHLNHPSGAGHVPVLYSAVRVGHEGRLVAFGRDLRPLSELQQRLVDAQQSLEQDYSRMRRVEMRYRLLFQMSAEAVLVLDAATLKVTEANPAAQQLFGEAAKRLPTRGLAQAFDAPGAEAVQALLNAVRVAGRADGVRARLADGGREVVVNASLFREEHSALFLVRVTSDASATELSKTRSKLLDLVQSAPDGFVVIGTDSRIITANAAFLELAQLPNEEAARGEALDRWFGRQGVDLDVLITNLRQRGSVRLFATVMRGEYGSEADVEVSAVSVNNGGQPCYGLAIRSIGRRMTAEAPGELPHSVEHLTELVGRVSLKELVRQSTDVIERLCIEAALKMTGDNRASAAEMLGLSRQSFYVKLRRYGLGDLTPDGSELS
jgi:transcriptional regulator PpsR